MQRLESGILVYSDIIMDYYGSKFFGFSLLMSFFIIAGSFVYATPSGRNTSKNNNIEIKFVKKATWLAAKSYAIRQYGRNINILSNRVLKSSTTKKYGLKNSSCRRVVLKTKNGERKTLNICGKLKG